MAQESYIHVKGAREHNLKDVEVRFPRGALTVVTGVSGSGKSSLAFDTLWAEGYRKYIDSLSPRARQVLDQVKRPEVDYIHGLPPVIAIEQRTGLGANPRSTVATVTEISDYARLLWALAGEPHCPLDGGAVRQRSLDDALERIFQEPEGSRLQLLARHLEAKPSVLRDEVGHLRQRGFQRLRVAGEIKEIDDGELIPSGREAVVMEIVVDRLVVRGDQRSRLADSLELAFELGQNQALVLVQREREGAWEEVALSRDFACTQCGTVYAKPTPRHFSYDHPEGACATCGGLGKQLRFDAELVVPDKTLSVRKGAIKPWRLGSKRMIIQRNAILKQLAEQLPFDATVAWEELPEAVREVILHGAGERRFLFKLKPGNVKPEETTFEGVLADLEQTRRETSSDGLKARLTAYQVSGRCPGCGGKRLNDYARAVTLQGEGFAEFSGRSLADAVAFAEGLRLPERFRDALNGLRERLSFLLEVGLGYLTLERPYGTLSGGEAQRVRLATQLGMGLVGAAYVLDEPSIGLHPHDNEKLLKTLLELRDRGNAVIVVEHDAETIRSADHVVELGPGAGEAGGRIIYEGRPEGAMEDANSRTGPFLAGRERVEKNAEGKRPGRGWLTIVDAREHNLRGFDAALPVGLLTVVTGVSGSGKSTLLGDILAPAAKRHFFKSKTIPGAHGGITGWEHFEGFIEVDQSPIGRSPRSNPATFTKLFDPLRQLFARTPLAKIRGYGASRFSFNTPGGRCEVCKGDGAIKLDMQFLPDTYAECPSCRGARYNRETLEVRFKGLNIAEVLELPIEAAVEHFRHQPKIHGRLETLQAVGLGYLKLGQPANTLSGGEAQRLKLSLELAKRQQGNTLYLLDEPTTGLHWVDIQLLADLLFKLRDAGNTIVVIEHNVDFIELADWVLDLGPRGGDAGGELLYAGTVAGLRERGTLTGQALRPGRPGSH